VRLDDFDYDLPRDLIAQEPAAERDASRLLVVDRKTESIIHHRFTELPQLLVPGDRLVVNDTRVVPARVFGTRNGSPGRVEVLLLAPIEGAAGRPTFQAMARPARKLTRGQTVHLGTSRVPARVVQEVDEKTRLLEFPEGFAVGPFLEREGHVPLPPYIRREDGALDRERYQTLFARHPGAVAAPTAGLHFTPQVVAALEAAGIPITRVTLNVGAGTFAPVVEPDPRDHVMEREYYRIEPEAAAAVTATRRTGGRIVAVGTTVVRTLETAEESLEDGALWTVRPGDGWSEKFIYPPYTFHLVDALLTNFHLPRSTLLILVAAFAGLPLVRRAYHLAVAERYRFYSYGDAMLIL